MIRAANTGDALMDKKSTSAPRAWWREPMMWIVVGGPLVVVLAAIATAVIAVKNADTVLDTRAGQPAVQGRNHAATPPAKP